MTQRTDHAGEFARDENLVLAALHDASAFEQIVARYYYMVFSVAYAHLRDPEAAEELAQETLVRAFLHLEKLRHHCTLAAWLNRIARNESLKWIEKRQNRSRLLPTISLEAVPMQHADDRFDSPGKQAQIKDEQAKLANALNRLPADEREIVVMHYMEELGKSEIARRLNLHPSSVGRKLDKALGELRSSMGGAEIRGIAPRPSSGIQKTAFWITAVAALSAASKASLAEGCADAGLLAASMPAAVSQTAAISALGGAAGLKAVGAIMTIVALSTAGIVVYRQTTSPPSVQAAVVAPTKSVPRSTARAASPALSSARPVRTSISSSSPAPNRMLAHKSAPTTRPVAILPMQVPSTELDFLEGSVVDTDGVPVVHAYVDVDTWYPGSETFTDEAGKFRIDKLRKTETVQVRISKDGYSPFYEPTQPLGTMASPVVLGTKTAIEGKLTDPNGQPVAGLEVKATMREHQQKPGFYLTDISLSAITDKNGFYRIALSPETYTVTARKNDMNVKVDASIAPDETKHLDLQFRVGEVFRARVIDSMTSEPVARALFWFGPEGSAYSDTSGVLEIKGLPPGDRELYFKKEGYFRSWSKDSLWDTTSVEEGGWQFASSSTRFRIRSDRLHTIVVEKAVLVRGVVIDPDSKPVGDCVVVMQHPGTDGMGSSTALYGVKADANGRFEMSLPASKDAWFRIVALDTPDLHGIMRTRRQWADGRTEEMHGWPGDHFDNVTVRLPRPATIRGRFVDNGTTRTGASLPVVIADWPGVQRHLWKPGAEVNDAGEFELKFVSPGDQKLSVYREYQDGDSFSMNAVTPAKITMQEGEAKTVDLVEAPLKK